MSKTYTIAINEQQRRVIEVALRNLYATMLKAPVPLSVDDGTVEQVKEETVMLFNMFEELPKSEREMQDLGNAPGQGIHGFCF